MILTGDDLLHLDSLLVELEAKSGLILNESLNSHFHFFLLYVDFALLCLWIRLVLHQILSADYFERLLLFLEIPALELNFVVVNTQQ